MLSIFLIVSVCLNVLIPKSNQLKENFMMALSCAVGTIESNFFDGYANTVDGVMKDVLSVIKISGFSIEKVSKRKGNKQDKKEQVPVNSASDSCITERNNIEKQKVLNIIKEKINGIGYVALNDLNILYNNIKISCEKSAKGFGILFFILFSILVVRIKDTIAVLYNNNRIVVINRLG